MHYVATLGSNIEFSAGGEYLERREGWTRIIDKDYTVISNSFMVRNLPCLVVSF